MWVLFTLLCEVKLRNIDITDKLTWNTKSFYQIFQKKEKWWICEVVSFIYLLALCDLKNTHIKDNNEREIFRRLTLFLLCAPPVIFWKVRKILGRHQYPMMSWCIFEKISEQYSNIQNKCNAILMSISLKYAAIPF